MLKGEVKDVLLLDVTPLSLGIETKGGVMTKLIDRNTTIPTKRTEVFTTAEDMQPSVEIHVLQGEREMAQFNKTLGKFQLVDLPPAPRGVPQIEVTFDIDANGIVHVAAKDRATGKEQSMTITGQSSLAKDDIDQMVKDAEAHAEEDRRRREEAEVRNQADTLVYQTEKLLKEQGDKISGDEKSAVEDKLGDLKGALGGSDVEAIRNATDALMSASQTFTQKLYEAASAEGASAGAGGADAGDAGSQPSDDDVVDAEIVDDEDTQVTDDATPSEPAPDEGAAGAEPTPPSTRAGDGPAPVVRGRAARARRRRRAAGRSRRRRGRPRAAARRAGPVPRGLPPGPGRLRELPQAGPEAAGRRRRALGRPVRREPAARARLRATPRWPTGPAEVEPVLTALYGALARRASSASTPRARRSTPPRPRPWCTSPARAATRWWPRSCAPATAGRARCCAPPWSR